MRYYYKSKDGNGFLNLKLPLVNEDYIEISEEEFNEHSNAIEWKPPVITEQQKYENRVVELIRKKYSLNQELAILRQRDEKPEEYQAYHDYAEQCKATAKAEILEV